MDALNERLLNKGLVQLLLDDDVYWAQKGTSVGPNTKVESDKNTHRYFVPLNQKVKT